MKKLLFTCILLGAYCTYGQITITPGGGTAAITSSLFGPGVTVSGMTINCPGNAYGTFTGSLGTSGMTAGGILLTTGSAALADGPNTSGSAGTNNGTTGSPLLAAAQPLVPAGTQYYDECRIEFDLVPQCNTLSINFCFGSEEYPEFVSSSFNDGFGIFISGPNPSGGSYTNYNMARLPSGQVVSIDNVNAGVNPAYYNTNTSGIMQYDGYTDGLVGTLNVTPCATYHFAITIADAGDHIYDSGVFLQFQGLFCSVPSLAATTSSTPTTCGGNNGTASVNVTTGTGPFTYSWTNASGGVIGTGTSVTGLAPGTYTITVNDNSPCTPPLVQNVTIAGSTGPTVTPVAETCSGYNNGSVTIDNAPGAGPYTVTINGPTTATVVEANTAGGVANFTNLPDGNYTFTVTGSGGCSNNGTFTINAGPPCCSVTASGVNASCFGGTNGTVTANPTGLAGFGYSWNTTPVQITQTASGLAAGTYTVTMTDAAGCTATANVTIGQPTQITGTTTNVNPLCNGGTNGSITVNASGGTGALQYSINGGPFQVSNVFTGLAAGTYTIIVRDANNCTTTLTATLTNPPAVSGTIVSTTPATCGVNNGTITVSGSGGTGAYTYSVGGPFQASGNFTGLAAGTYTVTVRDANNCTFTLSASITSSGAPTASIISQTNLTCFGGANGSVLIGVSGGSTPFTYSIDMAGPTPPTAFQASNSFTGLLAGTYTATVQDANGCQGTVNFTITAPTAVSYTSTPTPASCNGVCDGQITVNASGGTAPYEYSSNSGLSFSPTSPITGLCAGNVNLVVRDANGCLANSVVNITQPAAITATYTLTNPVCPDVCNGQIQVNGAAGGTGALQYAANGGPLQASNVLTGLCNGPNTIVVQDANGCQLTSTQNLVDPAPFNMNQISMTESNCGFNNGSFEVQATGAFPPYSYNNVTIGVTQPTGLFTNLVGGSYEIQITDNNGCMQTFFAAVNDIEMNGVLDAITDATCHGSCDGEVFTHATGGFPPIQYELDGSGSFMPSGDFTGLCAGSHIVMMVDNGFCVFNVPFTIVEPAEIFFSAATTNVLCNGGATGSITINSVTGGNGVYQYSNDGGVTFQASNVFNGLAAGNYNLVVQDGNGCTGVGTATINEATPITFTVNTQDLTCAGNNTGFLQIVATGGTGALTYSNNGGSTYVAGFSFVMQPAGTYNLAVQDAVGCVVTGTATISEPAPLVAAYVSAPALCNGSCDGSITVNASGGTTPYIYSDDNGLTYQPSNLLSGLCAGSYQITVKDSNNCLVGSSVSITEPTAIAYTTVITSSTCGSANGVIDFNPATGGSPGYQYSIDGGTTFVPGTNFPGLSAGNYDLTVEDANGCQSDATATITNAASPVINAVFVTDPLCFNDCNGTADITATGGTGALQYSIDGGAPQASNIITGICAGAHTVEVVDANGCTDTQNINLVNPTQVSFTSAVTDLTCYQNSTGAIAITASGGTGVYTYSYDNGVSFTASSTNNSIPAGTYDLVVSDGNNCTATGTEVVNEPAQLVFTAVNITDASCAGVCDGVIDVVVSGGTAAAGYTYTWGSGIAGSTASTANSVCVGSYVVIVEDDNGCIIDTVAAVNEPAPVVINSVTVTDALCAGSCDGTVTIAAPAATQFSAVPTGNAPVFGASNVIGSLCAGSYDIAVQDAAGCATTTTAVVIEPTPLSMVTTPNSTICYASDFDLFASASGGTSPYTYSWSNGFNGSAQLVNPTALTTYDVTVTDDNGCVFGPVTVTVDVIPALTATISPSVTICPGSQATLGSTASNGLAPYHYYWQTSPVVDADTMTFTPSAPGAFTVNVIDQCNDTVSMSTNVLWYNAPNMSITLDNPNGCSPLITNFTANFGGGFVSTGCEWDFGNGDTSMSCTNAGTVYTAAGCYDVTLTVTSAQGCVFDSTFADVACVYPDPVVDFTYNPSDPNILEPMVNFTNLTTNGVSFNWNFAGLDSSQLEHPAFNFNMVEAGEYMVCLEVESNQGCMGDTCKPVIILDQFLIYVPNAFTPDADGVNEIFIPSVKGIQEEGYEFYIFDRWGELIFQTTDKDKGWDGTHNGIKAKEDVYVWKLKGKKLENEDVKEYYGHVTLLR